MLPLTVLEQTVSLLDQGEATQIVIYRDILRVSRSTWLYWRRNRKPHNQATEIALTRINVVLRKLLVDQQLPITKGSYTQRQSATKAIIIEFVTRN